MQLVSEMASAAGLECAVDPALAAALRNQKTGMLCHIIYYILTLRINVINFYS